VSNSRLTVGLIGCGNAGRNIHMRLLRKHAELYEVVACADAVPESAARLAADFGLRALEVEALLGDPGIELVVVVTRPPVTHRDLAVAALGAGKHVVVEKPMAGTSEECAEMVAAAESAGRVLAVHHNRRWDVDFLTARHLLESGAIGEPRLIRNEYTAGFEGSPYDWGIHLVDQTMALSLGQPFVELTAALAAPAPEDPPASQGFFTCRLRTADGVLHDLSMLPPAEGSAFLPGRMTYRFALIGTEGAAYLDWSQRPEDAYTKTWSLTARQPGRRLGDLPFIAADLAIPDFYQCLHAAIREGGPVPVTGQEGQRAVRAWELICESACEGRTLLVNL
jgi:scyllo-inositol 2-dehydrogenase (NADP+)